MKLKLTESFQIANQVLRKIDVATKDQYVVGYENGREHGFSTEVWTDKGSITICWAQCRNSDQIIVYVSRIGESFERNTNIPTDRAYRAAKYFSYDQVEAAAKFISDVINLHTKKGAK